MKSRNIAIPDFGELINPNQATLLNQDDLPEWAHEFAPVDANNPLWEYVTLGTIDGYRVAEDAKGLPIESAERLQTALVPVLTPDSEILVISADDKAGLDRYNELKRKEAAKELVVLSEASQYDSSKSAYIVWIKYSYVEYRLAPRFEYLKEK